jgi:molybdopterin molybdotransferase
MTGAKMPHGADTVIMQEHVERGQDHIVISHGHQSGQCVRHAGDDIRRGATVMPAGRRLTAADIGLLASLGSIEVRVVRRIRAAFVSTGDELCPAGRPLADGQIYDSNRHTLHAMLQRLDADIIDLGIIADDRAAIEQTFAMAAAQADVLITSGGVSIGEADFVKETLERLGQVGFWKIAIKPGRPLAFGHIGKCLFFGLPGNPVSAMATFYTLVQPALLRLAGVAEVRPRYLRARLLTELKKKPGRLEFQRGILSLDAQGELQVSTTGGQDSHLLSSMGKADCFIIVPLESSRLAAGETVQVQPFAGLI